MKEELKLFNDYVKDFDMNIDAISLKYYHTFRVINYAVEIARSLNLSEEDIDLCRIGALFHDIGRFSQYMEFGSYDDYDTIDHGDRGEEVLKDLGYNNDLILKIVKLHNKAYLPNGLSDRETLFCNIIRDADKIDIMIKQANVNNDKNYFLDEENRNRLLNNKLLQRIPKDNNCLRIYKVIAFIFDINYKKSFEIIKKEDIINKKMNLIINKFSNEETNMFRDYFNNYVDKKLENI